MGYTEGMELAQWVDSQPLTVSQVADLLGVHRVTLHGWMAGRNMPRPAKLTTIRSVTGGKVGPDDMAACYAAYTTRAVR